MGEKVIYLAGRPIPIAMDAPVSTYADGGMSFYNTLGTASQSSYSNMMMRRPSGMVFSPRRMRGMRLGATAATFGRVAPEEIDALREGVYQMVLHADITWTATDCFNVLVSRGLSTHFMINNDGALHQPLDIYHAAWATGNNNNQCIAVDLNNPIKPEWAEKDPANPPRQLFSGKVNGSYKNALGYTDAQYATLIALLRALITPLKIERSYWVPMSALAKNCFPPMDENGEVIKRLIRGHEDFVGFMGHWHCEARKWDPGPGFDWNKVLAGVHGDRNSFPVLIPGAGNLADLTGDALNASLNVYFDNIEGSETGGWYPLGANQSWHSGVHLHVDEASPVYSMAGGVIIAVRNAKRVDLGDPGFILVRHEKKSEAIVIEGEEPEPVYWYALYMHARRMEKAEEMAAIPWVSKLLAGKLEPPEDESFGFDDLGDSFPPEKMPPKTADGTNPLKFAAKPTPFFDGDIILTEIEVESGEQIGYVGVFGSSEWTREPQLHVEILSAKYLFEGEQPGVARQWIQVEGDMGNDSLVDIERVIKPVLQSAARLEDEGGILKTSEIQNFYVDGSAIDARRQFRKMACYHQSEWSPQINWTKTAASAVGWQWETQEAFSHWLLSWVPFRWMNAEVTAHAKFPEEHKFFTYHPIYYLAFLNQNYSGSAGSTAEAASDDELTAAQEAELANQARLNELMNKIATGESLSPEEEVEYEELYALADAHLGSDEADALVDDMSYDYDGSFDVWEPGEWEPPVKPNPVDAFEE